MPSNVSALWQHLSSDLGDRAEQCIRTAGERLEADGPGYIFFRADDVAAPGRKFDRLMDIFKRNRVPLCLAVVPAWLTGKRWQYLQGLGAKDPALWCWHQHGWRHINHETAGKKQEFGAARSRSHMKQDLLQGKRRLEDIMEAAFYPVFTPPWNRCSSDTIQLLQALGYAAVSRTCGSQPEPPQSLPDFCVNVDLHTRKEPDPICGWNNLFSELQQAISTGCCGIMIHHQRMNTAAFEFLDILIQTIIRRKNLQIFHFKDLAAHIK